MDDFDFHMVRLESDPNVSQERVDAFVRDWLLMEDLQEEN